ncbi:MAG: DUF4268 domain-containing protein [Alphaproteobacteria bacterium]|nr:DUF4268 domain-containing protein [Alphaproteobacteria bacterium]
MKKISLVQTEANVGSYRADIIAKEPYTDSYIVIENQLECSNHDHLGKIITYASGYDAKYIIWIVKDVDEPHIQAINWLNEKTDDGINFFLLKIELWQIGDSAIAPKFQVICRPNEWGKTVKGLKSGETTKSQSLSYQLWSDFKEYAQQRNPKFSLQTPRPQHWYSISIGSSEAHIDLHSATRENEIGCQLYIRDNYDLYRFLEEHKSDIETKLGFALTWNHQEGRKSSYMEVRKKFDLAKDQASYLPWMFDVVSRFYQCFNPYVKKYK